jgi:AcrR family transcriptional regulator
MSTRLTENFPHKLLEAGVSLFAEKSFHGTGVKDIVERAGVPKGSFYNYFDSKEAFGAAILRHYADVQAAEWQQYSRESGSPDLLLALRTICERIVADYEACDDRYGCLLGNFAGENRAVERTLPENRAPDSRRMACKLCRVPSPRPEIRLGARRCPQMRWRTSSGTRGKAACCA